MKLPIQASLLAALTFSLVCLSGCGDGKPKRYKVTGTVTFDGKPIEKGEILISPVDGRGRPDAGRIINGSYEFKVTDGEKRVEITASSTDPELVGELPKVEGMAPGINIPREYIPERYNESSELRVTIEPNNSNEYSFDLEPDEGV